MNEVVVAFDGFKNLKRVYCMFGYFRETNVRNKYAIRRNYY